VNSAPAVEVTGLTKVFEKGRRTIWQRLRREPDRRERFVAVKGIDLRVERGELVVDEREDRRLRGPAGVREGSPR